MLCIFVQYYDLIDDADGCSLLSFSVPRDANDGIVNNRKELFKFRQVLLLCEVHRY